MNLPSWVVIGDPFYSESSGRSLEGFSLGMGVLCGESLGTGEVLEGGRSTAGRHRCLDERRRKEAGQEMRDGAGVRFGATAITTR